MVKKLVITAVALLVGLVIVKKTTFGSLMQVWWKDASTYVERQVPPETKVQQLKLEIGKIDGDIRNAANSLVKLAVEKKRLSEDVDNLRARLDQQKKDMLVLIEGLEQVGTRVTYHGQTFSHESAQIKLDSLRAQFEAGKESLKIKEQLLRSKAEHLEAADQRITKIKEKKGELTDLVAKMESQLELLRIKQMDNHIEVNDSQVSKCEKLYENLKTMVQEEEEKAKIYARYGLTTITPPTPIKDGASKAESVKAARAVLADDANVVDQK